MSDEVQRLAELAELRLELAAEGRWDELAPLHAEAASLTASLPHVTDAERPALERALVAEGRLAVLARGGMDDVRAELVRLGRGRGVVRAYGQLGAAGPAGALA